MILNTYAVLTTFVALLRLLLALLLLVLGAPAWRAAGRLGPEDLDAREDRCYLVFLLALLLVGLNLASWPLLYALLQSYVPQWPGVMCIYGVTRVGADSPGPSGWLPGLLRLVQLTKPALVFAGAAWFVLYLLNRRTRTAPRLGRRFAALLALGALAAADAGAELAYVVIPKKEALPPGGCCTTALGEESSPGLLPPALLDAGGRPALAAAYYGGNLALIAALLACARPGGAAPGPAGLALLVLGGAAVLAASGL